MNNILILGGTGNTGKHIVDLLYKFSNHNIIVIARDKKKLLELQKNYIDRVTTIQLDANNLNNIETNLNNIDLIVLTAPSYDCFYNVTLLASKLNCKFLDIHSPLKIKLDLLKKTNIKGLFVTNAGLWPGTPLALARYFADDNTTSIHIAAIFNKPGWRKLVNKETLSEHDSLNDEYLMYKCILKDNFWNFVTDDSKKDFDFLSYGNYKCDPTYLEEIYLIKKYVPSLKNFGIYSKSDIEDLDKDITFIKVYINEELKLELYHNCGWFMTAVATTATIFQMLASNKKGLFLNGEFIDPIRYIDDLKKLGTNLDYK
jgi:saccharopine dehydrogenase-like NADP-dependent oxidoreductase